MIIGIWGDSVTYGACDNQALGWAGRLRKALPADDRYHIYNFGICGQSSRDLLKRFQIEFEATLPEKVFFAVALNDSKYPLNTSISFVSLEEYKENMLKLIQLAKTHTKDITLIGPTCVGGHFKSPRGSFFQDQEILKYRDALKEISHNLNISFIDLFDVLDPKSDLEDGIHPNAKGYQKMFEAIFPRINFR